MQERQPGRGCGQGAVAGAPDRGPDSCCACKFEVECPWTFGCICVCFLCLQELLQQVAAGSDLTAAAGIADDSKKEQQQADDQQQQAAGTAAAGEGAAAAAAAKAEGADAMDVDVPQQQQQQPSSTAQPADSTGVAVKQEPSHPDGPAAAAAAAVQPQQEVPSSKTPGAQPDAATSNKPNNSSESKEVGQGSDHMQQQQQQQQRESEQEGEGSEDGGPLPASATDPHSLRDPQRPFNPLSGCRLCWNDGDKARLLLCDGCEDEYHCYCVNPVLLEVPEGDWYCRLCRHEDQEQPPPPALQPPAAAAAAGSSSGSDWDMAAAAALPETCTAALSSSSSGMQHMRALVGAAQRLSSVLYGEWPAAARLELLLLLCELLGSSNAGRRFIEERMEAKREAKKKVGVGGWRS